MEIGTMRALARHALSVATMTAPLVSVAGFAALTLPAHHACGQVRIAVAGGRGGGSMSPVSRAAFKDYAGLLGLSGDQNQSAQELFDGYRAAFKAARDDHDAKMQGIQETMRDTGDIQASIKEMQELGSAFGEKSSKLEDSFMSDLKSVLTEKQMEQWPAVERHRRRETGLRQAFYSGAGVDLIATVAKLKADPGTPEFASLLSQYEMDMDRRLQEASRQRADLVKDGDKQDPMDFEAQQARMKKMGESSRVIRDLNRDYVKRLGAMMTPEHRAALDAEFSRRSFPSVYAETHAEQCLKATAEMADLETTQKETIAALLGQYRHDAQPLNDAWAKAVDAAEEDAGGSMLMEMNKWSQGGAKDEVKKSRADRKDLDTRVRKRLDEVLTPAQRDRLPAKKPSEEGGGIQIRLGGGGGSWGEEADEE